MRGSSAGPAMTGDRRASHADKQRSDGYEYAHAIIDDHSRLSYAEIHADAKAATVVCFLERALRFYAEHEIKPQRLMSPDPTDISAAPRAGSR